MTVIGSAISWTHSTWNPWVGCVAVSEGCKHCYAQTLVEQRWRKRFDQVELHLERLKDVKRFRPLVGEDGLLPHMVFVNSLSDFFFEQVPDETIHTVLDAMEEHPTIQWQILTKRPIRARKMLIARYGCGRGIPRHIWIGVTAEDNRVAKRLDILRSIGERTGGNPTLFASVEPIVGPTDQLDISAISWVITGGESGPGARRMERDWLVDAVDQVRRQGVALWHKQNGTVASHPNIDRVPQSITIPSRQLCWLHETGWEFLPREKGGATIDRQIYRQLPPAFDEVRAQLSSQSSS
jgi:protein gp37